jgi:hypothetical protein
MVSMFSIPEHLMETIFALLDRAPLKIDGIAPRLQSPHPHTRRLCGRPSPSV